MDCIYTVICVYALSKIEQKGISPELKFFFFFNFPNGHRPRPYLLTRFCPLLSVSFYFGPLAFSLSLSFLFARESLSGL